MWARVLNVAKQMTLLSVCLSSVAAFVGFVWNVGHVHGFLWAFYNCRNVDLSLNILCKIPLRVNAAGFG